VSHTTYFILEYSSMGSTTKDEFGVIYWGWQSLRYDRTLVLETMLDSTEDGQTSSHLIRNSCSWSLFEGKINLHWDLITDGVSFISYQS
jgi:hypothetical protein